MFAMFKICTVLALAAPFASALQITSVTGNAVSEGSLTIQWSTSTSDPSNTFSVELIHASFNAELALANNVDSSSLSLTVELNNIPVGDGYTIAFVDISDVNTVFTQSEDFSIGPVSQTQSVTVTGSASSSVKSSASKSASASGSGSASSGVALSTKPAPSASNTGFGTTGSATPSSAATSSAPSSSASTGAALSTRSSLSLSGALLVAVGVAAGAFAL